MNYVSFTAANGSPTWGIIIDAQAYDSAPAG